MAYKLTQGWPVHLASGAHVNPDSNAEYLAWLEAGNTPEPADPEPTPSIQEQINALERKQLMPRATREFMLMFMELNAPAEVLAVNIGYQAVKAFDNQIKALRESL